MRRVRLLSPAPIALLFPLALACGGADESTGSFAPSGGEGAGEAGAAGKSTGSEGGSAGRAGSKSGGAGSGGASSGKGGAGLGGNGGAGGAAGDGGTSAGSSGAGGAGGVVVAKKKAPYPIVLAHGFFGFEKFAGQSFISYFYKVKDALEASGEVEVFTPAVDPFNSSEVRGAQLAKAVEEILAKTGREKVNLIGHSQGGLDARVVAHDHPEWVASVVTISTPHRGSEIADVVLKVTSNDRLAALLDDLVKVVGAPIYGDVASGTSLSSSMTQLSTASVAAFNAKYTDAPGVAYLSFAGRSASHLAETECKSSLAPYFVKKYDLVRDPIEPLLAVSALIVEHGTEIPSDGLVTIESAKWGEFHGCIPADHFDEIGHLFGDSPGFGNSFEHIPFYEGIVELLRTRGL